MTTKTKPAPSPVSTRVPTARTQRRYRRRHERADVAPPSAAPPHDGVQRADIVLPIEGSQCAQNVDERSFQLNEIDGK